MPYAVNQGDLRTQIAREQRFIGIVANGMHARLVSHLVPVVYAMIVESLPPPPEQHEKPIDDAG